MTNDDQPTRRSVAEGPSRSRETEHERIELFRASGPIEARIVTRSGDVTVQAIEGDGVEVTLSSESTKYDGLLELAEVEFDPESNRLEIKTQPRDGSMRLNARMSRKPWFDFGGGDLDVLVVLPHGSSLEVKTISGDASFEGPLDEVSVSSISGDVVVNETCDSLDVRTASGDVTTEQVHSYLKCRSASGDVECSSTATKTEIVSASGDVSLSVFQPGLLKVKAVSGDVNVHVARGLCVDINGNSVSGELETNIDLNAPGDFSDDEAISINVTTVSGDIRIDKAS